MAISSGASIGNDSQSLMALRSKAASDPKAVIKEAAKQFENMFMQQLMKSMRESTMASGMLDNEGTKMGHEMLDGQLATQLGGARGGLADVIARQMDRQIGQPLANIAKDATQLAPRPAAAATNAVNAAGAKADTVKLNSLSGKERQVEFLKMHDSAAKAAEASTGIPANFMVAQAAHESGWGRREIKNADGSTSFNVFGVKAGANWKGPVAEVTTTEVIDGQAHNVKAKFRAYSSYEASFADYAKMMKDNPRYSKVVASGSSAEGFAQGLQKAGYATDPAYADKLTRMINTTLRLQRASA